MGDSGSYSTSNADDSINFIAQIMSAFIEHYRHNLEASKYYVKGYQSVCASVLKQDLDWV